MLSRVSVVVIYLVSMTHISIDDVQKLANLSGLSLTDDDAKNLGGQLETILGYVEQLEAVDTSGVEPTYQVTGLENVTREDNEIDYGLSREELLKNAPEHQDGQIKVGRVLG